MKKLLTALCIAGSMAISGSVCAQDFDRGLNAFFSEDYATALKELRPFAERGHPRAQNILAIYYEHGRGVIQDYKESVAWYRKAAEQSYPNAQGGLGAMYEYGKGVMQSNIHAHMWYNIAASKSSVTIVVSGDFLTPAKLRDEIAKKMTAADISKAQELARECVKKQYKGC